MHVDYLRLGTFDMATRAAIMGPLPSEARKATHWLQYNGEMGAHSFTGQAFQSGKRHYIAHVSGIAAHEYTCCIWDIRHSLELAKCRRIDLAHDIDRDYDPRELADNLSKFHANVTLMQSKDGWTIYINKRHGNFMVRLYRKYERNRTRLEFECKGSLAEEILSWLFAAKSFHAELVDIWHGLILRAKLPAHIVNDYNLGVAGARLIKVPAKDKDTERRIEWMFNALTAIGKLANDHEAHDRVIVAVGEFAAQLMADSQEIDKVT